MTFLRQLGKVPNPLNEDISVQIQTDASKSGIACALMQAGKPIAYASRALSDAEKNYAVIELEALAIVFACTKFHYYIYGRDSITILTDHKPLLSIFNKPIDKLPLGGLRNIRCKVLHYNLVLKYVAGRYRYVADCLPRMFDHVNKNGQEKLDLMIHSTHTNLKMSTEKIKQFKEQTHQDKELQLLTETCSGGSPHTLDELPPVLRKYWSMKEKLKVDNGLIYYEYKMIVPKTLEKYVMSKVHTGHQGETRCKLLERKHFYWSSMAKDIETFVKKCEICQTHAPASKKQVLLTHQIPDRPFQQVSADIAHVMGNDYLVLVDHFSKWLEIFKLRSKNSTAVQNALKLIFSQHGVPERLIGDNQPFNSKEMHEFAGNWNFEIINSSPNYPQSNGMAEKFVGVASNLIRKCQADKPDLNEALLAHRATPIPSIGLSPCQILYSRQLRLTMPMHVKQLEPELAHGIKEKLERNQEIAANAYNKTDKRNVQFAEGQRVYIYNPHKKYWSKAQVQGCHVAPRSYIVQTPSGSILRRTAHHMKPDRSDTPNLPIQRESGSRVTRHSPSDRRDLPSISTQVHINELCYSKNVTSAVNPESGTLQANEQNSDESNTEAIIDSPLKNNGNSDHSQNQLLEQVNEHEVNGNRADQSKNEDVDVLADHNYSRKISMDSKNSSSTQSISNSPLSTSSVEESKGNVLNNISSRQISPSSLSPEQPGDIASPAKNTGDKQVLTPKRDIESKARRQASQKARKIISKAAKALMKNSSDSSQEEVTD